MDSHQGSWRSDVRHHGCSLDLRKDAEHYHGQTGIVLGASTDSTHVKFDCSCNGKDTMMAVVFKLPDQIAVLVS